MKEDDSLPFKDKEVRFVKASDGNVYARTHDVTDALGLTNAGLYLYMKKNPYLGAPTKIGVGHKNHGIIQMQETSFLEISVLLGLLENRISGNTPKARRNDSRKFHRWLVAQELFGGNFKQESVKKNSVDDTKVLDQVTTTIDESQSIDNLVKKYSEPTSTSKETVILSVVVFNKCVLKLAINR